MADDPRFFVGTSGFSYDEWRPAFYPKGLKKAEMLSFYAGQLSSVELNNTFYRMPREGNVQVWSDQVPDSFRFAVKAPRGLTWSNKLVDCDEWLEQFVAQLRPLGAKLGCLFYQVPKFVPCDLEVLRTFLGQQPEGVKVAFDFVHESWHGPAVAELLHQHGATVVASDQDDGPAPELAAGAPWVYLRLRRSAYEDDELRSWQDQIRSIGARDAFVFFRHEDSCAGPAFARRFSSL